MGRYNLAQPAFAREPEGLLPGISQRDPFPSKPLRDQAPAIQANQLPRPFGRCRSIKSMQSYVHAIRGEASQFLAVGLESRQVKPGDSLCYTAQNKHC